MLVFRLVKNVECRMIILHVFHDKTAADTKLFRDNKEKLIS